MAIVLLGFVQVLAVVLSGFVQVLEVYVNVLHSSAVTDCHT